MTDIQKQIYSDMRSIDRVMLWLDKCQELIEFSKIMTEEDLIGIQKVYKCMERGTE